MQNYFSKEQNTLYIRGWKELSCYTGYHERTLRRWNSQRGKLPVLKTHPTSKNSRWLVTKHMVHVWLLNIGASFHQSNN